MTRPDLHTHTAASDGMLPPMALVNAAADAGVTVLAITDHDTLDGVDSLRGQSTPIPVLTGVELSLRDMHSLHLLGYGRTEAVELRAKLHDLAEKRKTRAAQMADRLTALGMPIDLPSLLRETSGTVGRPHIARAMVRAGYVESVGEAFDRWLGEDKPAYVAGERLSMAEALPLLRRNGFVPVLAHPALLNKDEQTLLTLLSAWQKQGLMGVEVYHPSRKGQGYAALDAATRRRGLLVTGGSDFHGEGDAHGRLGCTADDWPRREEDVRTLMDAMDSLSR